MHFSKITPPCYHIFFSKNLFHYSLRQPFNYLSFGLINFPFNPFMAYPMLFAMKTKLVKLILCLLLFTAVASAQNRFSVSATVAPAYSYTNTRMTFVIPDRNGQATTETSAINTSSFGYVAGLMAHHAFTPKWSISAGLWYSHIGRDGIFPLSPGNFPARIISRDLQVPLLINYRLTNKRISPYFSVGSLANLEQSTVFRSKTSAGPEKINITFRQSTDFRAIIGAGALYKLNQRLSLLVQPQLIWRFKPTGDIDNYIVYQLNGQVQLMYSF